MALTIHRRPDWDARPAAGRLTYVDPRSRVYAFLHYSLGEELGDRDIEQWLRNIQRYHQDINGWADIGYNLAVSNDGRVWEGRGWDYAGAHCPDFNTLGYGFVFLGDDDPGVTDVSMAAKLAIRDLFAEADARSGRQLIRVGHRDKRATTCPGDELYAWLRAGMTMNVPVRKSAPARPTRPPARRPVAPDFPLPRGHWFGPASPNPNNHSGFYSRTDRHHLARFQAQMRARGWSINVDGFYTEATRAAVTAFQREKGLAVDGLVGAATWNRAWTASVTK